MIIFISFHFLSHREADRQEGVPNPCFPDLWACFAAVANPSRGTLRKRTNGVGDTISRALRGTSGKLPPADTLGFAACSFAKLLRQRNTSKPSWQRAKLKKKCPKKSAAGSHYPENREVRLFVSFQRKIEYSRIDAFFLFSFFFYTFLTHVRFIYSNPI